MKKPKVIRINSDILNMNLKLNTNSFNIMTDDKVFYDHKEWVLLSRNGLEVDRTIHNIKKIFGGDICSVKGWMEDGRAEQPQLDGESDNGLKIGQSAQVALF